MASSTDDPDPIRVFIVDDHSVVRSGLRMLLENHPGLRVTGEAATKDEAVVAVSREPPDVILLDLDLGGESGMDVVAELIAAGQPARVLIFTGVRDSDVHLAALRRGAMGIVPKDKGADVLVKAIRCVHSGEVWVDRRMMGRVLADLAQANAEHAEELARIASLTDREREVIVRVGEGLKNKQIAERLFISETTVRHHLTSIFSKLGVSDRLELLIFAYRQRLVPLPPPPPTRR